MKLYAWQPDGHGQCSFFVMARSEKEARLAVENHIKEHIDYDSYGWGTPYYELTVLSEGEVVFNHND
jgi:hypothetical protein